MKKLFVLACVTFSVFFAGCGPDSSVSPDNSSKQEPGTRKPTIAVIPKGTTHDFWKSIHAGAEKAGDEYGVDIIWMGPEKEDDRQQQIQVVQNFIARNVDAIVVAPLDDKALKTPVESAVARGIPVVIIDSGLQSDAYSSFVATDNREGGRLGGRHLASCMGGRGKALLLRYSEGSASTNNREEGFLEVMQNEFPEIELVSTNQYAGATKESAFQASQNLLNKYGDDLHGVFCPNESSTFGMLRALETAGKAGSISFVGFDTSEGLIEGLRAGHIDGLVAQDPFDMGYKGVAAAVDVLNGNTPERRIPTGLKVITRDNVDSPEVQKLLNPGA